MSTTPTPPPHQTWTRDGFLISTDPSLISLPALTSAFAQKWMYWAKPLPADAMHAMVHNSLCFALYTPTPMPASTSTSTSTPTPTPAPQTSAADPTAAESLKLPETTPRPAAAASRTQSTGASMIGFARVITDYVTFAYLTDVYVLPEWQGSGLGKWLIECVQGVFEGMPHLRRSMLVTGAGGPGVGFYEKAMRMEGMREGELLAMSWVGPGWGGGSVGR